MSSKGCVSMWGGEMFIRKEIGEWGRRKKTLERKPGRWGRTCQQIKMRIGEK